MNIAEAIDHLWLVGANDHVSQEDASYLHPMTGPNGCETCFALEEVRKLTERLAKPARVRMIEDDEEAIGVPTSITLEPLTLPMDIEGETTLEAAWDIDELRFSMIRRAPGLELRVTGALELDGLIELRDKLINPAIEHHETRRRAEAEEDALKRAEHEARAEERAREEAERNRAQTFRGVSVRGTITENLRIHARGCSAVTFARERQTLGTVVFALTPDDVIRRLPAAMKGRLTLRFCMRCDPIAHALTHNNYLDGGTPLEMSEIDVLTGISVAIWDAHHAALVKYDEQENNR